jgi:hypothetical protein
VRFARLPVGPSRSPAAAAALIDHLDLAQHRPGLEGLAASDGAARWKPDSSGASLPGRRRGEGAGLTCHTDRKAHRDAAASIVGGLRRPLCDDRERSMPELRVLRHPLQFMKTKSPSMSPALKTTPYCGVCPKGRLIKKGTGAIGVAMMGASVREVISLDWDALRALGERADAGRLLDRDLALVGLLVRTVFDFAALLSRRDATLSRLRHLLFGPRSERRKQATDGAAGASAPSAPLHHGFSHRFRHRSHPVVARGEAQVHLERRRPDEALLLAGVEVD